MEPRAWSLAARETRRSGSPGGLPIRARTRSVIPTLVTEPITHLKRDERGVAWIADTNTKVIEATSIRQFVDDLELLAKAGESSDFANRVQCLPLR